MTIQHQRPSILTRWLRRCPACGAWFALHKQVMAQNIAGEQSDYTCSKCGHTTHDWNPDSRVKF